jgi:hypothetical protein
VVVVGAVVGGRGGSVVVVVAGGAGATGEGAGGAGEAGVVGTDVGLAAPPGAASPEADAGRPGAGSSDGPVVVVAGAWGGPAVDDEPEATRA